MSDMTNALGESMNKNNQMELVEKMWAEKQHTENMERLKTIVSFTAVVGGIAYLATTLSKGR